MVVEIGEIIGKITKITFPVSVNYLLVQKQT